MPEPGKSQMDSAQTVFIEVSQIVDAEDAARLSYDPERLEELRESMARMGLLEPISVFPFKGAYQVLDGQRRLMCARDLGWSKVRCELVPFENLAIEAIRLHKNQVHQHMAPWEEACFFQKLIERHGLNFEQVCRWTRRSEDYVSKRLVLLSEEPEIVEALKNERIPLGVAMELHRLKERMWKLYYLDVCLRSGTGTAVLRGWITQHIARGGLETRTQPTAAAAVVTTPPKPVGFICAFCDHEHGGRPMMQVWVHNDELQTVRQVLALQFKAMDEQAATEHEKVEAVDEPEATIDGE